MVFGQDSHLNQLTDLLVPRLGLEVLVCPLMKNHRRSFSLGGLCFWHPILLPCRPKVADNTRWVSHSNLDMGLFSDTRTRESRGALLEGASNGIIQLITTMLVRIRLRQSDSHLDHRTIEMTHDDVPVGVLVTISWYLLSSKIQALLQEVERSMKGLRKSNIQEVKTGSQLDNGTEDSSVSCTLSLSLEGLFHPFQCAVVAVFPEIDSVPKPVPNRVPGPQFRSYERAGVRGFRSVDQF